jgi:hypothetical protein
VIFRSEDRPVITGGVDTHAGLHVAAALDSLGGLLGVQEFPATATGYAQLLDWLGGFGTIALVGSKGPAATGRAWPGTWPRLASAWWKWTGRSAGRAKAATTGKGNPWPGGTLGEAAAGAARTKTFLASRYKRIVRRRGKTRALAAVGNSTLTIAWHLLSDPAAHFTDFGPDWHDRLAPLRRKRQLIAELERLSGKKVTLHDAA